jgi:hypothetical protein
MLCYVISCYVISCYVISWYVLLCSVMFCYVMSCYVRNSEWGMRKCNKEKLCGISNAMLLSYQRGGEMNEDLRNGELLQLYPQSF